MEHTSRFVGIDIASSKVDICWDTAKDLSHQTLRYDEKIFDDFLTKHPGIISNVTVVGMESTGDYHLKAARYFLDKGFSVKVINPIITKEYIRATVRGKKTDKTDAILIHKALSEGHGDCVNLNQLSDEPKELLRLSTTLSHITTQLILRLQSTKRKNLPGTEEIQKQLQEVINHLREVNKTIVEQATEDRSLEEEYIDSIPGFAIKLSAVIHHEIGDINRFHDAKALVAFTGLDPRIKQSGNLLNTTGRITKRGSPYLRAALFLAANVARQYDKDLAEYYTKKKNEGRSHKEILCMIGRKLLTRIHTVLKEQRAYRPNPVLSTKIN